jgi:hypothetical protein
MRAMQPWEPLFWFVMFVGFAFAYLPNVWMVAKVLKHGLTTVRGNPKPAKGHAEHAASHAHHSEHGGRKASLASHGSKKLAPAFAPTAAQQAATAGVTRLCCLQAWSWISTHRPRPRGPWRPRRWRAEDDYRYRRLTWVNLLPMKQPEHNAQHDADQQRCRQRQVESEILALDNDIARQTPNAKLCKQWPQYAYGHKNHAEDDEQPRHCRNPIAR